MSDGDSRKMAGEDELTALARRLPREVAPERDLWPGIEAGIAATPARDSAWRRVFSQAAAVLLLVGGSSGITWFVMSGGGESAGTPAYAPALELRTVSRYIADEEYLEPAFHSARADAAARLDEELERLPPETRAEVRRNIVRIRAAINEINMALAEEPDNPLLQELLLSMYREELGVMRRVGDLAGAAMYRTDI